MSKHQLFSSQEWQTLQFAVLDVFMMVAGIDGNGASDESETATLIQYLENPKKTDSELLRELLASIAPTWNHVLDAYRTQYKFDGAYFEQAFTRVRDLVDSRLSAAEAQDFKVALATQVGGAIANASGVETPDWGRVSEPERLALVAIAKWLGTDVTQPSRR